MSLVPCLLLALLASAPQKSKSEAKAFAGAWMTTLGPMQLAAKGTSVAGHYGWGEEGEVEGKLEGGRLVFTWHGPAGKGDGWFELWKDGTTFTGEATSSGGKEPWGGYRLEPREAKPDAGKVTDGQTKSGLEYHLRVPKGFDRKKRYTAVALLHGSNAASRDYVEGFPGNWPELAERYILVGFDGERLSGASRNGQRAFNATYVEFSGHDVGEPGRKNQTPWLLAQALEQLGKELPIERWYVSGHSQGGFLTLAVAMFYPERIAGAIEVAGNLLVQCEPDFFTDEKLKAAQRRVPIAIVHGEKDTVVEYSAATYTFDSLDDGGFPALRLFNAPKAGHPWAFLPLDEALLWLDELNAGDGAELAAHAERALDQERYRDAGALLARAREHGKDPALAPRLAALSERLDAAARPEAAALAKAMGAKDPAWVDRFWEFRARFGGTPAAEDVLASYAKLRAKHQKPAEERFYRARALDSAEQKQALYREIVEEYYASRWYRLVKGWLKP